MPDTADEFNPRRPLYFMMKSGEANSRQASEAGFSGWFLPVLGVGVRRGADDGPGDRLADLGVAQSDNDMGAPEFVIMSVR